MLNSRYLQTFLDLCDTRHFTRTAERLRMTQSGVSQHLKKLETELGALLFQRIGKQIEITPAGEKLRQYAQKHLKDEAALRNTLLADSPYHGACYIACSGSMAMQIYGPLLDVQRNHPDLTLHIEAAPNERIFTLLRHDDCDLGIVSQTRDDPDFAFDFLGRDPLCLIVPKDHPAQWDDLQSLGYINHPNGAFYARQVLSVNFPNRFKGFDSLPCRGSANQLMQILLPVSKGIGFTILPESTLHHSAYQSQLRSVPLNKPVFEHLYVTYKKHKPRTERSHLIEKLIRQNAGLMRSRQKS